MQKIKSTWLAKVDGNAPYYVKLTLNKHGNLSRAECTCPYEYRCKHIAAVWFAVLAQSENIKPTPTIPDSSLEKESCIKQLREICNRYARGCDYWESRRFANELEPFVYESEHLSTETQYNLLKTFYNRVSTIMQRSDDSDGLIGGLLDEAIYQLNQLYTRTQDIALRKQVEQTWKKWIDDPENFWLTETTGILTHWQNAMNQSNRSQHVLAWIEQFEKTAESYYQYQIAEWRYEALKHQDSQLASNFLQEHLDIPLLRNIAIEELTAEEEYTKAENLLLEAINNKSHRIYEKEWRESLLNIAQKTNQKDKAIVYAEKLILSNHEQLHLQAYQALKSACTAEQWESEVAKIEKYLLDNHCLQQLAYFFVLEKAFDKLKALLLSSQNILLISTYTAKIPKAEREEVVYHWLEQLELSMKELKDRRKYAQWVRSANSLLRKYPYIHDKLVRIAENFRLTYKHRIALIEELKNLKI
ncbi:hypothetical protein BMT54_00030 [Pasteurellaceae bacterium 15-036681]|nr:hypothetical protein BMT54_00030 [Pasteurellaceae bacterium 15-036681]